MTQTGALPFIVLVMLIDAMGFGIVAPVAPRLIMELTGTGLGTAAGIGGALMGAYAVMQFLCAPLLGNLSDRFGRRPILCGSLAALLVDYLLMSVAPSIGWLFVGRIVAGAAGATYPTANAVIADVTPASGRARCYGMLGAAWGVGFILGPVIGGLLGGYGSRLPFLAAAALVAVNLLLGLLVFRETLRGADRRPFTLRRANLAGALRALRAYPVVLLLLGVVLLYQIAHDALPATWTWYTMRRFGWGPREVGISLAVVGLATAIVQGALVGALTARLGERRAAFAGLAAGMISMAGYALAPTVAALAACIAIGAFLGLAMPAVQGLMTRSVGADSQGELQGAIAAIASLTAIVAPLAMTQLFRAFAAPDPPLGLHLPGAPFMAAAAVLAAAATLLGRALGGGARSA